MKTRILISLFLSLWILLACSMDKAMVGYREDLQDTIKAYNDLVLSHQFQKAELFATESIREQFEARSKAAKDIHVVSYRILRADFQTTKGEDIVKVEFDYLVPPSTQRKTLIDDQTWSFLYVKEDGRKRWRLITPLPEFK